VHPLRMSVKAACGWRSTRIRTFLAKEALSWESTLLTSIVPTSVAALIAGGLSLLMLTAMPLSRQERFPPQFKGALLAAAPMLSTHSNMAIPMAIGHPMAVSLIGWNR